MAIRHSQVLPGSLDDECYTNEAVLEDIEDGTSSVLSSSLSENEECLAFRSDDMPEKRAALPVTCKNVKMIFQSSLGHSAHCHI